MAVLRRWHGWTNGGQDSHPQITGAVTYQTTPRPAFTIAQAAGATAFVAWGGLGNRTQHTVHVRFRLSALQASGTNELVSGQQAGDFGRSWRVVLAASGTLTLHDGNGTSRGSWSGLTAGVDYTLTVQANATTGTLTARLHANGTLIAERTGTGTVRPLENLRVGPTLSSPTIPAFAVWDVLVTDDPSWPAVPTTPPSTTARRVAVIGDSLTFMDDTGYGRFTAAHGTTDGVFYYAASGKQVTVADYVRRATIPTDVPFARYQHGTPDVWLVALGTNDTGSTPAVFRQAVRDVLAALSGQRVVWVGLAYRQDDNALHAYNDHLRAELDAAGATYADWSAWIKDPARRDDADWLTTDPIHMTPQGYAKRAQFYALTAAEPVATLPGAYLGPDPVTLTLGAEPVTLALP